MATAPPEDFSDLLRHARRDAGLTQEDLAERAGISVRAVSNLERGINRAPHRETLEMLANALGLSPQTWTEWERARKRLSARLHGGALDTPQPKSYLPAPLTSFLGRVRESLEVAALLRQSTVRLVTLTGAGGIGKTRLGIAVAGDLSADFADGVVFVALAPIPHADLVPMAIAQALGVREGAGQTLLQSLTGYLRARAQLLVLDNVEHVVSGATVVGMLLEECPGLKVLATSRVPLRLGGEREYTLRSLGDTASAALFVERSRDVRPEFQPDDGQMDAIAEICRRLDGLPLAIELAAARSKILPPQALLGRLEHPLDILTSGPRDLPVRQQTLRATIAWSYDLLGADEQALFQALAVFIGGFTLEAAEAVGGGDVLMELTSLIDSNLVEQHQSEVGEPRFRMLGTIHEFGIELLRTHDVEATARERHARYIVDLVTAAPPFIIGPDQIEWLNRIDAEQANVRAALDWFLEHDIEGGLRMLGVLWSFWWLRTPLTEGREYFDQFLERADDGVDSAALALALTGAGIITEFENDQAWDRAAALHEQALSIWLDLPDPPEGAHWSYLNLGGLAERKGNLEEAEARFRQTLEYAQRHNQPIGQTVALLRLGNVLASRGHAELAKQQYREGLMLARRIGDPFLIAIHTGSLGRMLMHNGQFDEAGPLVTEALALDREIGLTRHIATNLEILGDLEFRQGRLTSAAALFSESVAEARRVNDSEATGWAQLGLGKIALRCGDPHPALDLFRQSVIHCRSGGDHRCVAVAVEALAMACMQLGAADKATWLHGWASAFRERLGIPQKTYDLPEIGLEHLKLRESLTETQFDAAWEKGSRLTLDELLDEATGETGHLQSDRS